MLLYIVLFYFSVRVYIRAIILSEEESLWPRKNTAPAILWFSKDSKRFVCVPGCISEQRESRVCTRFCGKSSTMRWTKPPTATPIPSASYFMRTDRFRWTTTEGGSPSIFIRKKKSPGPNSCSANCTRAESLTTTNTSSAAVCTASAHRSPTLFRAG